MPPRLCSCCGIAEILHFSHGRCADCNILVARAIEAISKARQDGCLRQGYDPSSWRQAKHRLDHAATHIYKVRRGDQTEDHLAHAICDLVMLYGD